MGQVVQLTQDLAIGKINHQREYGSRINNAWLAERKAQQAKLNAQQTTTRKRNYAGASPSRLNSGWGTVPTPPNWHLWQGLQTLRTRSREQARNNDYARRFIAMCKTNIVGASGISMQSRVVDAQGELDKPVNDALEMAWRKWSRNCDIAGRLNLVEMCRLVVATVAVDGECLVQKLASGPFAFQLKLIDPELLDIRYNTKLANGHVVRMGVEMDKHGKRLAYYLLEQADDLHQSSYYTGKHIRVPASDILHLFLPEMIDQARGVPWMASALVRMKNLHGYEEAAVIAARIGASKMGFFHSPEGTADALADDEDAAADEFIQDAEPGAFEVLPEGYDFTQFNPDYPHQQFGDFIKATLRGMASGFNVAYNGLANDLEGVNFSSIRAGVQEEREHWKVLQGWLIESFMRPVYEEWLGVQLALGNITMRTERGFRPLPAEGFDHYNAPTFQGRRWAWVDPLKDMKANEAAVAQGLKSRSEIIRDMGRDPDEVWAEIQAENKKLKDMGLMPEASGLLGMDDTALGMDAEDEAVPTKTKAEV